MSSDLTQIQRRCIRAVRCGLAGIISLTGVAMHGCASHGGPIFEPLDEPLVWPGPPEQARIRYVGELVMSSDLKPGRSPLDAIGEAIFGKQEPRGMLTPNSVYTDDAGRVFISDGSAQVVHVFDMDRREYERWPDEDTEITLEQPISLAMDADGRLLVADAGAARIRIFEADGRYAGDLASTQLERPCGIVYDPLRDRVLVGDTGAHQIVVLDMDGRVVQRIGERGTGPGQFNYPTYLAMDDRGRLYVSDSLNFRIQVFDAELDHVGMFGTQGDMPGYFAQPKGVALDSQGHIYVMDSQFEAMQIFDEIGRLLLAVGEEGTQPGQFWLPTDIHIDANDRIWIADSYNQRVQVFQYLPEEDAP